MAWQIVIEYADGFKCRATDKPALHGRGFARQAAHYLRDKIRAGKQKEKPVKVYVYPVNLDDDSSSVLSEDPWKHIQPDTVLTV
jgi:hypothetical protein